MNEAQRLAHLLRSDAAVKANRPASLHQQNAAAALLARLRRHGARIVYRDLADGIATLVPDGVQFPWHVGVKTDEAEHATIFDATGAQVATVDPDRARFSDAAAHNIAHAICLAVNTIAGHDTAPQQNPA